MNTHPLLQLYHHDIHKAATQIKASVLISYTCWWDLTVYCRCLFGGRTRVRGSTVGFGGGSHIPQHSALYHRLTEPKVRNHLYVMCSGVDVEFPEGPQSLLNGAVPRRTSAALSSLCSDHRDRTTQSPMHASHGIPSSANTNLLGHSSTGSAGTPYESLTTLVFSPPV